MKLRQLRQHAGSLVSVTLAVLVLGLFLWDRGKVTDVERRDRQHDVFPAYRRGDIDWIELVQAGKKLHLERRPEPGDAGDTFWQMTAPADERADPAAVDRLVGDLEFAGVVRRVDASNAPEITKGFDPPRVSGTLSMKPLVYHFALGGPAPVPDGAAYLRVEGEGTYVVSKDFVTSLLAGPDAYRERNIVPYLSLDLAELAITSSAGTLDLKRADEVVFKLAGSGLRASRDGMDKVWGALAEARAEAFLPVDEAERALGANPVRVVMTPKLSSRPQGELLLGEACPGHPDDVVLLRRAPTPLAACVPKGAKAGLAVADATLVDHRLFTARSDEVEEIILTSVPPRLTVELARKGRGWHERKPTDRELVGAEADAVNDLVSKLTRADGTDVKPGPSQPPFAAHARVEIKRAGGGASTETVLLDGTTHVKREIDGAELTVTSAIGHLLVPSEVALRSHAVFGSEPAGHKAIAVRTHCDGVEQSLTHDGTSWHMREPRGFRADALATSDLVALVRNARAESWVADQDDGTFGFEGSACKVEVDLMSDGGVKTLGIIFGRDTEGGAYAHTTTDSAVFIAPRGLREGMNVWVIDRGGFQVEPANVKQVTLSRGAAHAVLTPRKGDGGSDRTTRALEALAVLRPEVVTHLGPPKADEGFGTPTLDVRIEAVSDAGTKAIHFALGDTVLINRERMVYLRVEGVEATYAVARESVGALIEGL